MTQADGKPFPAKQNPTSSIRTAYLTLYNLVFATLWTSILITTLSHIPKGKLKLFEATEPRIRWIQTITLIEVGHAAIGLVKSPVSTTFIQVVTRVIQVWLIWHTFPETTATSLAYGALVVAWSIADAVRYAYLALNLHGRAPGSLVWLRYSMFYALYPVGIGAEWWLFYRAVGPAGDVSAVLPPVFYFLLALYGPGAYKMYTYMIKQREKTLGRRAKSM
ncbi:PTPLA-domain-containing protein [Massarina eburnea CBS 473.64]|uniref:Very-long-chain (3R)-3-hydroxyacyl-CoA dehydratase n=1 Tax=Massarina eburnea CBS 473.64 TaxID=1395130 RepID=A0A6A6RSF1_9PLEO|nr:PTPLA-domain-containing protein [Massarina eburnea CBS 473.64]